MERPGRAIDQKKLDAWPVRKSAAQTPKRQLHFIKLNRDSAVDTDFHSRDMVDFDPIVGSYRDTDNRRIKTR